MDVDNTLTRVEDLWFSDGNLVIQAEQSLFRVFGGILAARSPIFKDMLSFTQPPDAETIEGCPVVRLPDRAEDLTCFFRAIFDSSFFENYPTKVSFESVLSVLRCSDKYEVEYLRRRALVHLSHEFPTILSSFDGEGSSIDLGEITITPTSLPPLAVIRLARQTGALWLLPCAFYVMARTDNERIQATLQCTIFNGHPAKLSADDETLFLTCSLHLSRLENHAVKFLHSTDDNATCGKDRCSTARLRALSRIQTYVAEMKSPDPLDICSLAGIWDDLSEDCCLKCYNYLVGAYDLARQEVWDKLPGLCGLPPWPELEKMKADALGT